MPKYVPLPPGWSVAAMRYHHMHGQREAWTVKLENENRITHGTGTTFADAINNALSQTCLDSPKTLQAA